MDVDPNYNLSEIPMPGLPIHKVEKDTNFSPEIQISNNQENTDAEMKIYDPLAAKATTSLVMFSFKSYIFISHFM